MKYTFILPKAQQTVFKDNFTKIRPHYYYFSVSILKENQRISIVFTFIFHFNTIFSNFSNIQDVFVQENAKKTYSFNYNGWFLYKNQNFNLYKQKNGICFIIINLSKRESWDTKSCNINRSRGRWNNTNLSPTLYLSPDAK